jgi:hypothetical protein
MRTTRRQRSSSRSATTAAAWRANASWPRPSSAAWWPPTPLSDAEVWQLIFAPGFSTADKVTDLSGRGVGMDVVKRNIEALRGQIHSPARSARAPPRRSACR